MKQLLFLLLLLPFKLSAQNLDSCGINNSSSLNVYEAVYFNKQFQSDKNAFDFLNKRLLFVTGSSANVLTSKRDYFDRIKRIPVEYGKFPNGASVTFFTDIQKLNSGGYDAIVTYYSKIRPSANRVIKQVNRISNTQR